ncbi:hydroxyacid dehydrogenase [Curtobacterium pusillum]|uniref:hydroxyacid dehydrogenase n=1 Tax=Curtobacterium pusillum TaxID=69373 RepID=UPI0011AA6A3B|nr:hydroxyacid dehydrogenase [Curtobacterium pusillum]
MTSRPVTPPATTIPPPNGHTPVPVAFVLPDATFTRVFDTGDIAALHSSAAVRLVADRPLDPDDPRDAGLFAEVEVIITGWGSPVLDGALLDRMPRLRAIAHSAGSVKPVVDDDVWDRALAVTSSAAANAVPVAEFAVAMIVLAAKRAFATAAAIAADPDGGPVDIEGSWPVIGMHGITVGVVGASRVGRAVIERLRDYDVRVLVSDPFLDDEDARALGVTAVDLETLAGRSDVITLHAPLLPSTRGLIDRSVIARMRPGTTLVNTARGGIVDQDALADRLDHGDLAAVLDVTEPEHLPAGARLRSTPNTFITPHIAGSLGNELRRLAGNAVRETIAFATTGAFTDPIVPDGFAVQA